MQCVPGSARGLLRQEHFRLLTQTCVQGVLNYVIIRPLMTAVSVIATLCHAYGDGDLRFDRVYIYVVAINNFSQVCAVPCFSSLLGNSALAPMCMPPGAV